MGMRILYIAEIVGRAGVFAVKTLLPRLRREFSPDFTVACGDGATGGRGIGKNHSVYLRKLGVDALTSGECVYYKKDMVEHIQRAPYVLRCANYPPGNPGRGFRVYEAQGKKLGVVCLLGQSSYKRVHLANPFLMAPDIAQRLRAETPFTLLDFHAATTAEKRTMFSHADGLFSAIVGSHGRVQTRDEAVSAAGTASITDAGRTGCRRSVGGMDAEARIREFTSQVPEWTKDSWVEPFLEGVFIELDDAGKATRCERIREACPEATKDDGEGKDIEAGGRESLD